MRTMMVLTTGDPVPEMLRDRGPFAEMIRKAAAGAYAGPLLNVDARKQLPAAETTKDAFVVITGSSHYVPDREPWVLATEEWLFEVVALGTPVFGICFGHQLLGQCMGGETIRNPRGREIGSIEVVLSVDAKEDPILEGIPPRFIANVTHLDTVGTIPRAARALATSSKDDHQIVRFAEKVYGVQFHPELDPFVMRGYFDARRTVLESEGRDVDREKSSVAEAPMAIRVFENFIRLFA